MPYKACHHVLEISKKSWNPGDLALLLTSHSSTQWETLKVYKIMEGYEYLAS